MEEPMSAPKIPQTDSIVELTVYVVSDSTGDTAQQMVGAALAQFQDAPVRLARRTHVRTLRQVRAVVHEARGGQAIIIHTLVADELRRAMQAESRLHNVDALDLMGPILERLATHLKIAPQEKPGPRRNPFPCSRTLRWNKSAPNWPTPTVSAANTTGSAST